MTGKTLVRSLYMAAAIGTALTLGSAFDPPNDSIGGPIAFSILSGFFCLSATIVAVFGRDSK